MPEVTQPKQSLSSKLLAFPAHLAETNDCLTVLFNKNSGGIGPQIAGTGAGSYAEVVGNNVWHEVCEIRGEGYLTHILSSDTAVAGETIEIELSLDDEVQVFTFTHSTEIVERCFIFGWYQKDVVNHWTRDLAELTVVSGFTGLTNGYFHPNANISKYMKHPISTLQIGAPVMKFETYMRVRARSTAAATTQALAQFLVV